MSPAGVLVGKIALVVGATATAAGVTYVATRPSDDEPAAQAVSAGAPNAWIDAPVDGALVPLAPVVVTTHAAAPAGIVTIDLVVTPDGGGEAVAMQAEVGGAPLEVATFDWEPPGLGVFELAVTGTDADGGMTATAVAHVEVTDAVRGTITPGTTPSLEIGTTSSSSTTSSSTSSSSTTTPTTAPTTATSQVPPSSPTTPTTACPVAPPSLVSPADGSSTIDRTPTLSWSAPCDPPEFLVQLGRDSNFRRLDIDESVDGADRDFEVPVSEPLICGATYYWRIGVDGQFSPGRQFRVLCRAG